MGLLAKKYYPKMTTNSISTKLTIITDFAARCCSYFSASDSFIEQVCPPLLHAVNCVLTCVYLISILIGALYLSVRKGYKAIQAALKSQGVCVQRGRLRKSVKKVDPTGVERRKVKCIQRRVYSVRSPLALWHIDSHHELIRYRHIEHLERHYSVMLLIWFLFAKLHLQLFFL